MRDRLFSHGGEECNLDLREGGAGRSYKFLCSVYINHQHHYYTIILSGHLLTFSFITPIRLLLQLQPADPF